MQSQSEARAFLQKILRHPPQLPFETTMLPRLFSATRDDSTASVDELGALIERSQKLTARILAIANSAAYGLEHQVSTVKGAIWILGLREIRLLVVQLGVESMFKEVKLPASFDINGLWNHQLLVAVTARTLARELKRETSPCGPAAPAERRLNLEPDEAYIAGLLHDIGKVFFAAARPDLWETVNRNRLEKDQSLHEAERDFWGMDHALIGAGVLNSWNLPALLTEPINWHHTPELAPTHIMDTRLLAAANFIAHSEANGRDGLCDEAARLLPSGRDAATLAAAVAQSRAEAEVLLQA